jgi:hypothetical protein
VGLGGASTDLLAQQETTLQAATSMMNNEQNSFINESNHRGSEKN